MSKVMKIIKLFEGCIMKGTAVLFNFFRVVLRKEILIPACAAGLILTTACEKKEEAPPAEVIRPVKVMTVMSSGKGSVMTYPGKTRANRRVDLSFKVPGPLVELPWKRGSR